MSTPSSMHVPQWPRITALVRPDGTGGIEINGTHRQCAAATPQALRVGMIARCTAIAAKLRRPVRLTVQENDARWTLAVRPDGVVQPLDGTGHVAVVEGLSVHEGSCRSCGQIAPVTAVRCATCGIDGPLQVETPAPDQAVLRLDQPLGLVVDGAGDEVPDEATSPRSPVESGRIGLRLSFSSQPSVIVHRSVALGRRPDGVQGRTPLTVISPERMLSRTHALVDVDASGRILVTDYGSGNGVEVKTSPPRLLAPHVPHVIDSGTVLHMGDVDCLIELVS